MPRPMQSSEIASIMLKTDALPVQVDRELNGQTLAGLINNAGIANHAVLVHQPIEEFRNVLEINLVGVLAVTQASHIATSIHASSACA